MATITKNQDLKRKVPFEEAVSMAGIGLFNILVLFAAGGGLMCVIIETMCMMFIIPAAQCDLDLSLSEKGILSSISFIGVFVGSYMWGYLADTKGRKMVLVASLSTSSLTTLLCSMVPWDWLLIILRFVNGFLISGASSVVYAYAGEFHDNHHRPKVISWMCIFVAFGNMILPSFAWLILPQEWRIDLSFLEFRPWRLLLIFYTLPGLVIALVLYNLPESPKFLLTQRRPFEALEVLKYMYAMNSRKSAESYGVNEIIWEELGDNDSMAKLGMIKTMWRQTAPLFKGDLLLKTLMMCCLQFGIYASNAGISMWYPDMLNKMSRYANEHPERSVSLCSAILEEKPFDNSTGVSYKVCTDQVEEHVFLMPLIISLAYALMYLFVGSVISCIGKKKLMISILALSTICGFTSQFVYGYELIQILIGSFMMGGAAIGTTNAIAVDLFPTQVRAMGLSVAMMFGRIGAVTGTNIVGPLIYNCCDYLFYFVAADNIILIIVALLLPSTPRLTKLVT